MTWYTVGSPDLRKMRERSLLPADFKTHFLYVKSLAALGCGLELICSDDFKRRKSSKILQSNSLRKKINLVRILDGSLNEGYSKMREVPEFSGINIAWVPTMSYYLLFNTGCILEVLRNDNADLRNIGHGRLHRNFVNYIRRGNLSFSNKLFNGVFDYDKIERWSFEPGSNLSERVDDEERFFQLIKKISEYKLENFKVASGIRSFRNRESKGKRDFFMGRNPVNIFEFFYYYRLKSNYWDLEFLNNRIEVGFLYDFCDSYYSCALSFFGALKSCVNDVGTRKYGKKVLDWK